MADPFALTALSHRVVRRGIVCWLAGLFVAGLVVGIAMVRSIDALGVALLGVFFGSVLSAPVAIMVAILVPLFPAAFVRRPALAPLGLAGALVTLFGAACLAWPGLVPVGILATGTTASAAAGFALWSRLRPLDLNSSGS